MPARLTMITQHTGFYDSANSFVGSCAHAFSLIAMHTPICNNPANNFIKCSGAEMKMMNNASF